MKRPIPLPIGAFAKRRELENRGTNRTAGVLLFLLLIACSVAMGTMAAQRSFSDRHVEYEGIRYNCGTVFQRKPTIEDGQLRDGAVRAGEATSEASKTALEACDRQFTGGLSVFIYAAASGLFLWAALRYAMHARRRRLTHHSYVHMTPDS